MTTADRLKLYWDGRFATTESIHNQVIYYQIFYRENTEIKYDLTFTVYYGKVDSFEEGGFNGEKIYYDFFVENDEDIKRLNKVKTARYVKNSNDRFKLYLKTLNYFKKKRNDK